MTIYTFHGVSAVVIAPADHVWIVIGVDLAQRQLGAIMLLDHLHRARRVIDRDRVARPVITSSRFTASLCSRT